ncbi:unnamed protein product [Paramecium octaurelia]|uniref:J domain-containing protein n=1 Tax=Paramecium octaurelia TaxID=43137 RepID=A0A8S1SI01_PAROT|nr:unnamed protein product [Paramecium octaurelia]
MQQQEINHALKNPFQPILKKVLKVDEELERLSSETFYNPFDVLYLGMEATDEDIKKMFNSFSKLLHPDKCQDPRAKDCWQIVDQAYKTLMEPEKRKVYIRIMREAREKTEFERLRENKRREKTGVAPLPPDTFESDFQKQCKNLFSEIEDRKQHLTRLEQSQKRYKLDEYERRKMLEQYKILTEEEWEKTRDDRVNKWREFNNKKTAIGTKQSNKGIRPPTENIEARPFEVPTKKGDFKNIKLD